LYTTDEQTFQAITEWHSKTESQTVFVSTKCQKSQPQWPCILRRGSVTTRLLRLKVQIQWRHGCLSLVSVMCCQVEVPAVGQSLVQSRPTGVVYLRQGMNKA